MERTQSINATLVVFAEWWEGDESWLTVEAFAEVIGCSVKSMPVAFHWLRRNGYVVTLRRVWDRKCNLYNVQRCSHALLSKQVSRSRAALTQTRKQLMCLAN